MAVPPFSTLREILSVKRGACQKKIADLSQFVWAVTPI